MVKALFALAKYLTWWFTKPLVSCCCVANLTHMLQTSSFHQTHVLVASNSISLSCLEVRIYLITVLNPLPVLIILLNPLPVLVARWKILREILLFTCSFMINTHPLVGCLENSDRKVKQFRVIPWIASSHLVYCSLIHCPNWNVSGSAPRIPICIATLTRNRHCANQTAWLEMAFKSSSVINLVYSYKANQTRFECSLLFLISDPTTPRQTSICSIFRLWVIIKALLKKISLNFLLHFRIRIIVLTCPDINKSARNHQPKSCVPAKSHISQQCEANIISIEIFAPFQFVPVRVKTREYHH